MSSVPLCSSLHFRHWVPFHMWQCSGITYSITDVLFLKATVHYSCLVLLCLAPPAVSRLQIVDITSPLRLSQKLINLEFSTVYEIFVSAMTAAGPGEGVLVLGETLPAGGLWLMKLNAYRGGKEHLVKTRICESL